MREAKAGEYFSSLTEQLRQQVAEDFSRGQDCGKLSYEQDLPRWELIEKELIKQLINQLFGLMNKDV